MIMLSALNIKNFTIIDDLQLEFYNGFNVLTGETGAGKSIIIDALGLLIGDRATPSLIKNGANKAYIEGIFLLKDEIKNKIEEILEDEIDENVLYVSKDIYLDGRSVSRINGRSVTINLLKEVMSLLVDIHSQHDNQYLLNPNNYLSLLDNFMDEEQLKVKNRYLNAYKVYLDIKNKFEQAQKEKISEQEIEFIQYQNQEIEAVGLKENEIEELEKEQKRINQFAKFAESINGTNELLGGEDGAIDRIYLAKKLIEKISDDEVFSSYYEKLDSLYYDLVDILESIKLEFDNMDIDEHRINEINNRIYKINTLKRKYGKTYEAINELYNENLRKIDLYYHHEEKLKELEQDYELIYSKTYQLGLELSQKRYEVSQKLISLVSDQLKDLYLTHAKFDIQINRLNDLTKNGIDKVDFLVSMNPGQPLKTISKVASGGEISRLMLGLKTVFTKLSGISTIVFDEVDTGVSGKVALAVGDKMSSLGIDNQVLCITHLAQVASYATNHYHVSKHVVNNDTFTKVTLLTDEEHIVEVAKLISGNEVSDASIQAAKELIVKK